MRRRKWAHKKMLKISYKNQRVSKQTEKDRCLDTMQWSSSSSFLCLMYTLYAASQVRSVVNDVPREAGTRPNWNEKTSSIKSSCIEETERREKSEFEIRKKTISIYLPWSLMGNEKITHQNVNMLLLSKEKVQGFLNIYFSSPEWNFSR